MIVEKETQQRTEAILAQMDAWVETLTQEGRVEPIDPGVVRGALECCGAVLTEREELDSLARYSNKAKAPGMEAVWGEEFGAYKTWVIQYIKDYEARTKKPLPVLEGTEIKHSGMRQFLGELTALAAGRKSYEEYKRLTEDRARKGREWQARKEDEPIVPSPHASFPPEFPRDAWGWLKAQREMS